MDINLAIPIACMLAPTAAGYVARRAKLLPERAAAWIMTGIVVFGYSAVALLTIWKLQLKGADAWLPVLGMAHVCIMTGAGLIVGRVVTGDRSLGGLFALATAVGNTGFTLGGFVIYLLEGEPGHLKIWLAHAVEPIGKHCVQFGILTVVLAGERIRG